MGDFNVAYRLSKMVEEKIKIFHKSFPLFLYIGMLLTFGLSFYNFKSSFDEGMYLLQAQLICNNKIPYQDFTTHILPIYIKFLSLFCSKGSVINFFHYRVISFFITTLSSVLIFFIAKKFYTPFTSIIAALLFQFSTISYPLYLTTPTSIMMLLALLSLYLQWFFNSYRTTVISAISMGFAFMIKPYVVPLIIANFLSLIFFRRDLRKIFLYSVVMFLSVLSVMLYWHISSDGISTKTIIYHLTHYSKHQLFLNLQKIKSYQEFFLQNNIKTPFSFAWYAHYEYFFSRNIYNSAFWTLLVSLFGLVLSFYKSGLPSFFSSFLALNFILNLLFFLFIFQYVRDNSFVNYLPSFSLLSAHVMDMILKKTSTHLNTIFKVGIMLLVLFFLNFSFKQIKQGSTYFFQIERLNLSQRKVLTFDPVAAVIAKAEIACNFIDEGQYQAIFPKTEIKEIKKLLITSDQLISCLQRDEKIIVLIDSVFYSMADEKLKDFVFSLDKSRIMFL
ncbi:MAG: glycosyltransferase family 39 protein [Oligoflexia bacterium]|nr:glycosyltransferase family 39 protein [Oligoflexia bacterium]